MQESGFHPIISSLLINYEEQFQKIFLDFCSQKHRSSTQSKAKDIFDDLLSCLRNLDSSASSNENVKQYYFDQLNVLSKIILRSEKSHVMGLQGSLVRLEKELREAYYNYLAISRFDKLFIKCVWPLYFDLNYFCESIFNSSASSDQQSFYREFLDKALNRYRSPYASDISDIGQYFCNFVYEISASAVDKKLVLLRSKSLELVKNCIKELFNPIFSGDAIDARHKKYLEMFLLIYSNLIYDLGGLISRFEGEMKFQEKAILTDNDIYRLRAILDMCQFSPEQDLDEQLNHICQKITEAVSASQSEALNKCLVELNKNISVWGRSINNSASSSQFWSSSATVGSKVSSDDNSINSRKVIQKSFNI